MRKTLQIFLLSLVVLTLLTGCDLFPTGVQTGTVELKINGSLPVTVEYCNVKFISLSGYGYFTKGFQASDLRTGILRITDVPIEKWHVDVEYSLGDGTLYGTYSLDADLTKSSNFKQTISCNRIERSCSIKAKITTEETVEAVHYYTMLLDSNNHIIKRTISDRLISEVEWNDLEKGLWSVQVVAVDQKGNAFAVGKGDIVLEEGDNKTLVVVLSSEGLFESGSLNMKIFAMENIIASFRVNLEHEDGTSYGPVSEECIEGMCSIFIPALKSGVWSVNIEALDKNGYVIGKSTYSTKVIKNRTQDVEFKQNSTVGSGYITLRMENFDGNIRMDVVSEAEMMKTVFLEGKSSGISILTFPMKEGIYKAVITENSQSRSINIEVVEGKTTVVQPFRKYSSFTIVSKSPALMPLVFIDEIPDVDSSATDSVLVHADVMGLSSTDPSLEWYLDGKRIPFHNSEDIELDISSLKVGFHEVSCRLLYGESYIDGSSSFMVKNDSLTGSILKDMKDEYEFTDTVEVEIGLGSSVVGMETAWYINDNKIPDVIGGKLVYDLASYNWFNYAFDNKSINLKLVAVNGEESITLFNKNAKINYPDSVLTVDKDAYRFGQNMNLDVSGVPEVVESKFGVYYYYAVPGAAPTRLDSGKSSLTVKVPTYGTYGEMDIWACVRYNDVTLMETNKVRVNILDDSEIKIVDQKGTYNCYYKHHMYFNVQKIDAYGWTYRWYLDGRCVAEGEKYELPAPNEICTHSLWCVGLGPVGQKVSSPVSVINFTDNKQCVDIHSFSSTATDYIVDVYCYGDETTVYDHSTAYLKYPDGSSIKLQDNIKSEFKILKSLMYNYGPYEPRIYVEAFDVEGNYIGYGSSYVYRYDIDIVRPGDPVKIPPHATKIEIPFQLNSQLYYFDDWDAVWYIDGHKYAEGPECTYIYDVEKGNGYVQAKCEITNKFSGLRYMLQTSLSVR